MRLQALFWVFSIYHIIKLSKQPNEIDFTIISISQIKKNPAQRERKQHDHNHTTSD
jgi:hypothetical protein